MATIFLAFYTKENYGLLLQYADDRKKLDDKWEDWLMNFLKAKNSLTDKFDVIDFPVNVLEMHQHFTLHKLKNNAANRSKYVSEQGAKKINGFN
jgi:hypothetical protein